MASRKSFHAKPNYIYPTSSDSMASSDALFEFDESEIWTKSTSNPIAPPLEAKKWIPTARDSKKLGMMRKISAAAVAGPIASASLPVNIPDWSKILKDDYKDLRSSKIDDDGDFDGGDYDGDDGGDGDRIPPHEYLARTRGASLSVHEGVGRTLKGRDLRRVRNAIWKKVGFED
ncbi:hypothetical protein TIFTF001_008369 [Ficus carica]|uniref:Senescence regulator n=1 Tax=Ficus carica TaxID=3494 RepID=A0AA87ZSF1_FICCA|nr:hypothetical protein TIFTF001_008369 [Ficus carica]